MQSDYVDGRPIRNATAAQQRVYDHVTERCRIQLARFASLDSDPFASVDAAFAKYEPANKGPPARLVSDHVDLPTQAATCNSRRYLSADLERLCTTVNQVMPEKSPESKWPCIGGKDVSEYAALIGREIMIGKVQLRLNPRHVAGRFVVSRRSTQRCGPDWNDSSLSEAAAGPLLPRR